MSTHFLSAQDQTPEQIQTALRFSRLVDEQLDVYLQRGSSPLSVWLAARPIEQLRELREEVKNARLGSDPSTDGSRIRFRLFQEAGVDRGRHYARKVVFDAAMKALEANKSVLNTAKGRSDFLKVGESVLRRVRHGASNVSRPRFPVEKTVSAWVSRRLIGAPHDSVSNNGVRFGLTVARRQVAELTLPSTGDPYSALMDELQQWKRSSERRATFADRALPHLRGDELDDLARAVEGALEKRLGAAARADALARENGWNPLEAVKEHGDEFVDRVSALDAIAADVMHRMETNQTLGLAMTP